MESWQLAMPGEKFRPIYSSFPFAVIKIERLGKTKYFTLFTHYCLFFKPYLSLKCYFAISIPCLNAAFLMATYSALMGKWFASDHASYWTIINQVVPSPLYFPPKTPSFLSGLQEILRLLCFTWAVFTIDRFELCKLQELQWFCSLNYWAHHLGLLLPPKSPSGNFCL